MLLARRGRLRHRTELYPRGGSRAWIYAVPRLGDRQQDGAGNSHASLGWRGGNADGSSGASGPTVPDYLFLGWKLGGCE